MRIPSFNRAYVAHARHERALPAATGIFLVGTASLLIWGMIVGAVTIF